MCLKRYALDAAMLHRTTYDLKVHCELKFFGVTGRRFNMVH